MPKTEVKSAGFIFLHRSIRQHWIWKDAKKLKWWLDILMECNHADQKVSIGFELIECKRGQSLNSQLTWAKQWRVDVSTVRRFLKLLENDAMICSENVQKTTRITVCNYDSYNTYATAKATDREHPKQIGRKSDAIQTKNELKTNKEERGEYSPQELENFKKFQNWINDKAPKVARMKEPFTIKQYLELKEHSTELVGQVLKSMHNWEPLLKKNTSAYLTTLNWLKKEEKPAPGAVAEKIEMPKRFVKLTPAS
jgi:DNA-binding transcriptional regulator YhcF (GntR family)